MQRLLNEREAALIDARLHDNALLRVCREVWPERNTEITSVLACPEDIFCEVAWLTDELIDAERGEDALSQAMNLWTDVTLEIAKWGNQVLLPDRYLIVSTVFRIVATAFSLHWNSYYCEILRDALLETETKRLSVPKDLHEAQEQQRLQEQLQEAIIPYSEMLSRWVNDLTTGLLKRLT